MEEERKSLAAKSECAATNQNALECLILPKKCDDCKAEEGELSGGETCLQSRGDKKQSEMEPDESCSSDELSFLRMDSKRISSCNGNNVCYNEERNREKCREDINLCGKGETNIKNVYDYDDSYEGVKELCEREVVDEVALKQKSSCESIIDDKGTINYELRLNRNSVSCGNSTNDDSVKHCEESHLLGPVLLPKVECKEKFDNFSCPSILNKQKAPKVECNHRVSASNELESKTNFGNKPTPESFESEVTILSPNVVKSVNGRVKLRQKRSKVKLGIDVVNDTPLTAVREREANHSAKRKRSNAPDKEKLRECIRKMLLDFGWKIDYRPRRDRDYFDAVYINPSGTGYWSILKAYDALKKQLKQETSTDAKFSAIPDELLSQLTRNTKKKREREMKQMMKENKIAVCSKRSATNVHPGKKSRRPYSIPSAPRAHHKRKNRKLGRCTLLARSSGEGRDAKSEERAGSGGKRTILSWLLGTGAVKIGQKVVYSNCDDSKPMLEGWIAREGIRCGCCNKTISVSNFEIHSGSKLLRPFQSIRLDSGGSLVDCQLEAWNMQNSVKNIGFHWVDVDSGDPNDDICCLCGDGGSLLCCDDCPSTYHQTCLEIKTLPPGDWSCPNCTCKYCGIANNETSSEPILKCHLCFKKYHKSCVLEESDCFCGIRCKELFDRLQSQLGVKHELEGGYSWTLIHRTDVDSDSGVRNPERVECNSKVAVAYQLMDECFLPILDIRSGIEMVHNVVFNCGSNFNRLNFEGFYVVVLENGDEMISAASLRMHGGMLSEMPFVGTRHIYRRQGMWRRLMDAVESLTAALKVERLVIPAISEVKSTWQDVFGFSPVDESLKQELKSVNVLVFPGVDMLEKRYSIFESDECVRTGPEYPYKEESVGVKFEDGSSPCGEALANPTPFGGDKICSSMDCDVVCT